MQHAFLSLTLAGKCWGMVSEAVVIDDDQIDWEQPGSQF